MLNEDEEVSVAMLLELLGDGNSNVEIQQAVEDNVEEEKPVDNLEFNLSMLGLQRKDAQPNPLVTPGPTLNASGRPSRKRTINKTYYEEDNDDENFAMKPPHRSSTVQKLMAVRKPHKNKLNPPAEIQKKTSLTNKNAGASYSMQAKQYQQLGMKIGKQLRIVMKLPKYIRWCYCEWFYSNIDKCLFSENEFKVGLKAHFPQLKTLMMTRVEWNVVRRRLGKRRRCSDKFFREQREILANKRAEIHKIQMLKAGEIAYFKNLPTQIPMKLVIGANVTARLRKPLNGIFNGFVEAVDICKNTYRISFGKSVGTHSVPDYEVVSIQLPETIMNKNPQLKKRKLPAVKVESIPINGDATIPPDLLHKIVLVKKVLAAKKEKVLLLRTMNTEAESDSLFGRPITEYFERKYTHVLLDLEKINRDIKKYLDEISVLMQNVTPTIAPQYLRDKCKLEACERVQKINNEKRIVDPNNAKVLDLVSDISCLMLIARTLADPDQKIYKLQDLQDELENVKEKFKDDKELLLKFSHFVEIHFQHIIQMQLLKK